MQSDEKKTKGESLDDGRRGKDFALNSGLGAYHSIEKGKKRNCNRGGKRCIPPKK